MVDAHREKTITGYCEPLSLRAGEAIRLMGSSHRPGSATLDLVRIHCGDPTRSGPGFRESIVPSALPASVELRDQKLRPGSYGQIDLSGLALHRTCRLDLHVLPTRPQRNQTVLALCSVDGREFALRLTDGQFELCCGQAQVMLPSREIVAGRWYHITIEVVCCEHDNVQAQISTVTTRSPGRDLRDGLALQSIKTTLDCPPLGALAWCLLAASRDGEHFDGRLAGLSLQLDETLLEWDFAQDVSSRRMTDTSGNERHGELFQLPARGVTGPAWNGAHHNWTSCPAHYDAIHFHSDDLYDADWQVSAELTLPEILPSGIYAFRLSVGDEIDRIPFFVRPSRTSPSAEVALLMPSATYMAYANHRMLFEGADFVAARSRLRPEHEYIRQHPEVGPSLYEKHDDGSGVMYSSRRRPVLQLRPGADGWNFTPDTNINAFMEHLELGHDILTDEDLHHEGLAALAAYRVIVTGTHPEYWSTSMLDAMEEWLRTGGRLLYLGGNGFYWRVAFNEAWPGAIELRRAEDGVRNWQTLPGESYHSFNGEYGGLWRRLGRAPNELVGIGFAAQGFERAVAYRRSQSSYHSRAAWIFDGVDGDTIGASGLGGGAAGQEVDRYNPALGSPTHAVVLASATEFGPDMTRTKEELEAAITVPSPDPVVRADIVFFETPTGGAVFSVGSIAWFGALARNDYDNDIARVTENVLRRFLEPEEFELPDGPEKKTGPRLVR